MSAAGNEIVIDENTIQTPRLLLRPWRVEDADAALKVYGQSEVARWLAPAMSQVPDSGAMRDLMSCWAANCAVLEPPAGRWAVCLRDGDHVVGGATLLPLPPYGEDLEVGWAIDPAAWGKGLGAEAGHAVAHYAFEAGIDEVFAVVRPNNVRGAKTAQRVGMEWVGETEKYYDLRLQVYRLRKADLDVPELGGTAS